MNTVTHTNLQPLLGFYLKGKTNPEGKTLEGILSRGKWWNLFGFQTLEQDHQYIQWLFPTTHKSQFNRNAPTLSQRQWISLPSSEKQPLQAQMLRSLHLMLGFYGMTLQGALIKRDASFAKRSTVWMTPSNHNFLRLTRILSSLKLLGLVKEQKALFQVLQDIKQKEGSAVISEKTFFQWKNTIEEPLLSKLYHLIRAWL